jgi:pimeloyl-ACP methyl ester carboxylesterase
MEMPAEHDRREAFTHPGNPETLMTSATSVRAHLRLLAIVAAAASLGAGALLALPASAAPAAARAPKPTIVLVHGAFADASGLDTVVGRLQRDGYRVVAPANPLRSLSGDSAYLKALLKTVTGPVVLVGHSYGGAVISNAATGNANVKALVYLAAYALEKGETIASIGTKFPGSHLTPGALNRVPLTGAGGGADLYIKPDKFRDVFLSNRLSAARAAVLAATQRPPKAAVFAEASGTPAWKTIPSWYLVARQDHAIAPAAERSMAKRAKAHTVEVNAPHAVYLTDPGAVTRIILDAAKR